MSASTPDEPRSPTSIRTALAAGGLAGIVRHYKEKKSKCTVQPLVGDDRFAFFRFEPERRFDATGLTLLAVDGDEFQPEDRERPLLILDSTWRYLPAMEASLSGDPIRRRLPRSIETAYPRVSKVSDDPMGGLASIEALYAALRILGHRDDSLLDAYHWRTDFLASWPDDAPEYSTPNPR